MKPCIFCEIMAGRLAADIVYESENVVAFLDNRPLFPGHVLVVPRGHRVTMADIPPHELAPVMEVVRLFSLSMPRALGCQGSFLANNNVVSQSVPHLHWHIVPRTKGDGLKGFFWPRQPYASPEQLQQMAQSLRLTAVQEEILDFWFGPAGADRRCADFYRQRWFVQDAAFDAEIARRFEPLLKSALDGELDGWARDARGRMALLLLLDQFPRNLYRHTARCFDGDPKGQQLCLEGLDLGQDLELAPDYRAFFYLPLEHAETAELQAESLRRFEALAPCSPDGPGYLEFARRHAEIITRFGRYPHRNAALGRPPSPEEEAFLSEPGSSFW